MLKNANIAAKSVYPDAETIVHLANPQDRGAFMKYLNALNTNKVNYDVIGVTCYPYWQKLDGPFFENINLASKKFDKPVMIVETAYGHTFTPHENANAIFGKEQANAAGYEVSPLGQMQVLADQIDLLSKLPNNRGLGIFYWEPCWLPVKGANAGNSYGSAYQEGKENPNQYSEWKGAWANQALFSYDGRMLPSLKTYKEIQNMNEIK